MSEPEKTKEQPPERKPKMNEEARKDLLDRLIQHIMKYGCWCKTCWKG